ncbi:YybH family protein [Marinomonas flavescens]|uniref:YybH family protein n=1 Tax=Marinomonas flavescens TaxID=2529379 RepID=UPI00105530B5|nr:nuclear transport factor 2 family protein [Marinomonas flavescens]
MSKLIAKTPSEIAHCVSEYLQRGDLDGITTLFHPDCQIFFPPDQPQSKGIEGARDVFSSFLEIKPSIQSEILSEVIIGDIALLSARWKAISPEGEVISEGTSIEVAKKLENGGWGYLIDCPNGLPYRL